MMRIGFIILVLLLVVNAIVIARSPTTSREKAGLAMVDGRYSDAIEFLKTWTKNQPKDWASMVNLANLQAMNNQLSDADVNFRKALEITNHYSAYYEYAKYLWNTKQYQKALIYVKKALNDPKGNANVLYAKINLALGKEDDFKDELLNALKKNPKNEEAIHLLMPVLLEKKDFRLADKLLSTTLSQFPVAAALFWNGKILNAQDRPTAKKYFEQYLKYYPKGNYADECIHELNELQPTTNYENFRNEIIKKYTSIPSNPIGDRVLVAGKKWHYKVSWNFINLGRLSIEAIEKTTLYGKPVWKLRYFITSNPSVPIIDIDDYYESYVDVDFRYTIKFFSVTKIAGRYDYSLYDMDLDKGKMIVKTFSKEGIFRVEEKDLIVNAFDGTTILTWARKMIESNNFGKAVTVVDGDYEYSYILPNFEDTKIISLGVARPVKKFHAQVGYVGIAGLTGKATGWITSDWENLPLKANFQIMIGSIDVELEKVE
ncbi:MAG: DUF3108 domain-containing protein [bacterium]|nr:DUF3108 domain-containing protein [bacterium]